jgi:hypothetical protein
VLQPGSANEYTQTKNTYSVIVIKGLMSEASESLLNGLNITIFEAHKIELARVDHAWGLL